MERGSTLEQNQGESCQLDDAGKLQHHQLKQSPHVSPRIVAETRPLRAWAW